MRNKIRQELHITRLQQAKIRNYERTYLRLISYCKKRRLPYVLPSESCGEAYRLIQNALNVLGGSVCFPTCCSYCTPINARTRIKDIKVGELNCINRIPTKVLLLPFIAEAPLLLRLEREALVFSEVEEVPETPRTRRTLR